MFADHFESGIGVGKDAFAIVYPSYSLAGIESAPHSHNLYLQIGIELGIIGLVAFLVVILLMDIYNFTFYVNEKQMYKPARKYKLYSAAALCGVMAVLAQGMTDYVWYNYRIFLLFWLLLGLASAARKIARKEYSRSLDDM
jgi:O-antigen ligase